MKEIEVKFYYRSINSKLHLLLMICGHLCQRHILHGFKFPKNSNAYALRSRLRDPIKAIHTRFSELIFIKQLLKQNHQQAILQIEQYCV